ncbi:glycosyltransferase, partial [Escherichia coli]
MKVSIITVTYNSEKTIKDTLDSVAVQTYNNIEYIIVDGASSDATLHIIN